MRVAAGLPPALRTLYLEEVSYVDVLGACGAVHSGQGNLRIPIVLELQVHLFRYVAREFRA